MSVWTLERNYSLLVSTVFSDSTGSVDVLVVLNASFPEYHSSVLGCRGSLKTATNCEIRLENPPDTKKPTSISYGVLHLYCHNARAEVI